MQAMLIFPHEPVSAGNLFLLAIGGEYEIIEGTAKSPLVVPALAGPQSQFPPTTTWVHGARHGARYVVSRRDHERLGTVRSIRFWYDNGERLMNLMKGTWMKALAWAGWAGVLGALLCFSAPLYGEERGRDPSI